MSNSDGKPLPLESPQGLLLLTGAVQWMFSFLNVRQAANPARRFRAGRALFAALLAVLLCAALIAAGCGAVSAPTSESEDDAAVPAAAAEQDGEGAESRESTAGEAAASAEDGEPEAPADVAETEPEPASDAGSASDEAAVEEPTDWTTHVFVDGDYYVLGNPEAEVSILDAGDFL